MSVHVDGSVPTRDLVRLMRVPPEQGPSLPESVVWRAYVELRRRGEPAASQHFISGIRALHRRRMLGTADLASDDVHPDEHRLVDDPYLAELWRSYKRCVCANRAGPAAQILREVEQQVQAA